MISRRPPFLLQLQRETEGRIAPVAELVNSLEIEDMARRRVSPDLFAEMADSTTGAFDRITFRPRLMRDVRSLNLSLDLFGEKLFAPILIGPAANLTRFHPEGEFALLRGASAGRAALVLASKTAVPISKLVGGAKAQAFAQVESPEEAQAAAAAGCKALFYTLSGQNDWAAFDALRKSVKTPIVVKGVMQAEEAANAVNRGAAGVVVSNYRGPRAHGLVNTIDALPAVAGVIAERVPVLVDGGFRRGTDIMKALALGATAVLVARPALWALAAYGDKGVQHLVEMLQTELARTMAMCGTINLAAVTRAAIRIHSR